MFRLDCFEYFNLHPGVSTRSYPPAFPRPCGLSTMPPWRRAWVRRRSRPYANNADSNPASTAYAQTSQSCQGDICYQINIPDATASSGSGDVFFQMSAPTNYEWVGLGTGSQMSGSHMFILYQSADGTNVTVSPRTASGHSMPQYDSSAQVTLLEGSGVNGNQMVANIRCSSCSGDSDFSSSSASWIHASKSGSPIQSDDPSESISQHSNDYGSFNWDYSNAKGGSSVNPFAGSNAVSSGGAATGAATTCTPAPSQTLASLTGSGCPTAYPTEFSTSWPTARPTWAASCFPGGQAGPGGPGGSWPTDAPWRNNDKRDTTCTDASTSGSAAGDSSSNSFSNNGRGGSFFNRQQTILFIHGIMASLAFLVLFPTGAILIRLASFTGLIWVHAALQIIAYLIYIVAFGMGVWIAVNGGYITQAHPIIGIVLFLILLVQPLAGWLHHRNFKKYGRRTAPSYAHIGIGRIAIILGMVNGGLGLQLAGNTNTGHVVGYAVVAAVFGLAYILAICVGERKRKRSQGHHSGRRRGRHPPSYRHSQKEYRLSQVGSSEPSSPAGSGREYYAKRARSSH